MPTSLTVAVLGAKEVAKELGKKGTVSDLTLCHAVHDTHAVTIVEPTQFPEKLAPLVVAVAMADRGLLVVTELTRALAETIAVLELADLPTTVAIGPAIGDAELARLLKGGRLETAERRPLDLPQLRAALDSWTSPAADGPVEVPIDHAFPVKGVGAVALGVVRRGTLAAHERLRLHPTTKDVEIRSIQVHDIDRKEAATGERVGLALRGVDADELARGQVLAPPDALADLPTVTGGGWTRCRYSRGDAGPGAQVHLAVGLAVVPATVDRLGPDGAAVTADRPVAARSGMPAYLLDLSVPAGPRIVGRFTVGR